MKGASRGLEGGLKPSALKGFEDGAEGSFEDASRGLQEGLKGASRGLQKGAALKGASKMLEGGFKGA